MAEVLVMVGIVVLEDCFGISLLVSMGMKKSRHYCSRKISHTFAALVGGVEFKIASFAVSIR